MGTASVYEIKWSFTHYFIKYRMIVA